MNNLASANIDQADALANLQAYTPQFTTSTMQSLLSFIDSATISEKQGILAQLASGGLSPFIYSVLNALVSLANLITPGTTTNITPACEFTQPPPPPSGGDPVGPVGGCGGPPPPPPGTPPATPSERFCKGAGRLVYAAGLAFTVVGIMSFGAEPILVGTAWAGLALFGGAGRSPSSQA